MLRSAAHNTSFLSSLKICDWKKANCTLRLASTRQATKLPVEETATLPRFLRRKTTTPKVFRSKHHDPSNDRLPKPEIRLLEPHVLSARLKKLSDAGKLDNAIFMLKNSPLDAQNTQVWNTMIWETLKAQRYSLAYLLYIDMKRRGFIPTIRTFQTMFSGLARIENWSTHTKQLKNAKSLYEGYQKLVASVKKCDANDPDLTTNPLADYIRVLGKAGEYQTIFDVYYAMDKDGRLSPNRLVYTAMFQAIHTAMSDTIEGRIKVASDARLLWSQLMRAAKKNQDLVPDSYVVTAAVTALSGGNDMDHELAFEIIAEYYGLTVQKTCSQTGKFPLSSESLMAVLRFCNLSKNYSISTHFYQQVRRRPEATGGLSILDRGHMEEILRADLLSREPGLGYHALQTLEWMLRQELSGPNGPKIRPSHSTYILVMRACWHSVDWNSAKRTFDLMTGYHAHDFMDGSIAETPRLEKRGTGRSFVPNAEFMSLMLRTAIATGNRANLRQILRIMVHIGPDKILAIRGEAIQETAKVSKRRSFVSEKFNSALVEAVDIVLEDNGKNVRSHELAKFAALAEKARTMSS